MRQTGLYHQYDSATNQSTYILINPAPKAKAFIKAEEWLNSSLLELQENPFWLHSVLFSTYFPVCRARIKDLERDFLPLSDTTFATFIDEPLSLKYENLNMLTKLESHCLQLPTILAGAIDVLEELSTLLQSSPLASSNISVLEDLQNRRRQCVAYSRTARNLQQQIQSITRLLADTLLLRDQVVAAEQSKNMLQLNESAVFITRLSLMYLPPSFIAVSTTWTSRFQYRSQALLVTQLTHLRHSSVWTSSRWTNRTPQLSARPWYGYSSSCQLFWRPSLFSCTIAYFTVTAQSSSDLWPAYEPCHDRTSRPSSSACDEPRIQMQSSRILGHE